MTLTMLHIKSIVCRKYNLHLWDKGSNPCPVDRQNGENPVLRGSWHTCQRVHNFAAQLSYQVTQVWTRRVRYCHLVRNKSLKGYDALNKGLFPTVTCLFKFLKAEGRKIIVKPIFSSSRDRKTKTKNSLNFSLSLSATLNLEICTLNHRRCWTLDSQRATYRSNVYFIKLLVLLSFDDAIVFHWQVLKVI